MATNVFFGRTGIACGIGAMAIGIWLAESSLFGQELEQTSFKRQPIFIPYNPCPTPETFPPKQEEPIPKEKAPEAKSPAPTDPPTQAFSEAPSAGTGSAGAFSPTMFGDQFRPGNNRSCITLQSSSQVTRNAQLTTRNASDQNQPVESGRVYFVGTNSIFALNGFSQSIGTPIKQAIPTPINTPQNFPVKSTDTVVGVVNKALQPGTPAFIFLNQLQGGNLVSINPTAIRGSASNLRTEMIVIPDNFSETTQFVDLQYLVTLELSTLSTQEICLNIPNPSSGGVVGRAKISEDQNLLPMDRIIFNYDYFHNAVLTPKGVDVNRFVFGFEKTFLDGNGSIEIRIPFACTLDSNISLGAESRNTELGNVRITPRFLLIGNETFNVGAGLGIHLPSADDTQVFNFDGSPLVRIENQAVILSPYIGVLFTPRNRFFAQSWIAVDVDPFGNTVSANLNGQGLTHIGQLYDAPLLYTDLQLGYWIFRAEDRNRSLQALAPFVELHYGVTLRDPDRVRAGGFQIGDLGGRFNELNLSVGLTSLIGSRLNTSVGVVMPLLGEDSRGFDFQAGLRVNYFFGPTAQALRLASAVP